MFSRNVTPAVVCAYDGRRPDHVAYSINLDDVLKALQQAHNPVVLPKTPAPRQRVQTRRGRVLMSIKNVVDGVVKRKTGRGAVVEKRGPIGLGIENVPVLSGC